MLHYLLVIINVEYDGDKSAAVPCRWKLQSFLFTVKDSVSRDGAFKKVVSIEKGVDIWCCM